MSKVNIFKDNNCRIVILENIRFYSEEEKNDTKFAKHLATLGDIYVNDAFSCSHREHASIAVSQNTYQCIVEFKCKKKYMH